MAKIMVHVSSLLLLCALAFGWALSSASAHNGVDHSAEASDAEVADLQKLVALLTQVVELYKLKAASLGVALSLNAAPVHAELEVWVELHSNLTHAHVVHTNGKEESFLLEDLKYTEEEAIIEAIAEETGLSAEDIEEVIVFPSGEVDEKGDSVEAHDAHADQDVSGIHIMSDGKVMWGNGDEVAGATIIAEGKVELSDGRIITPKFDLR